MNDRISPALVRNMLANVHLGLRVLACELPWLAGPDLAHAACLFTRKRRRDKLRAELASLRETPRKAEAGADLSLLEQDIQRLDAAHAARHQAKLARVRAAFPEYFAEAGK